MADSHPAPPIVAFDLGGTRVRVALVDSSGTIIDRVVEPTRSAEGPVRVADRVAAMARLLLRRHRQKVPMGIGAAVAGPLDKDGVLYDPPNLIGWRTVPFKAMLEERFDAPVLIGNDANLACIGEHIFGKARGVNDFIYLTVSTGVGGGVITGGKLVVGWRGMGAEVGHIIIDMDGPTGRCGHRGCLESHVSGTAIADRARAAIAAGRLSAISVLNGDGLDEMGALHVFQAAAAGDALCRQLVDSVARELATGIVSLVHVFNPKLVILGGGVIQSWEMLETGVRQGVRDLTFRGFLDGLELTTSGFGDDVGVIGAAALVLQNTQP
ncbi:MAG: glucokinase, family [Dehalococcoidia bacterium]|nr:glucokinase, family [Dehalococcoidia bacterium]